MKPEEYKHLEDNLRFRLVDLYQSYVHTSLYAKDGLTPLEFCQALIKVSIELLAQTIKDDAQRNNTP